jgi:hypothetical protein
VAALAFPVPIGAVQNPAAGSWRSLFPEFNTAPDVLVQSRLDQAALQIDPNIWGQRAGEGQAYLAAHLLAIAPGGQMARLVSKDGSTTYKTYYDLMVVQVAGLVFRVI